jgi:FlaA1/EpsC-like NDP-sugar epimerase/lipopolysaccharide/colanic/teichoic acid biosynthesis glycosyltransferase
MRTILEDLHAESGPPVEPRPAPGVPGGLPRAVELGIAAGLLLITAPILALAALAIVLTSRGPALFRQERMGRGGRRFLLLKLRTMRVAPPGLQVTAKDDPRTTPLGRFLRRAKLDELPQLWNVLRGDMSLVGPRPEVPRYVDLANPIWQQVLSVRPGVTDPSTLRLFDEEEVLARVKGDRDKYYREKLLPLKLQECLSYLEHRSWRSDISTLLQTILDLPVLSWPSSASVSSVAAIAGIGRAGEAGGPAADRRFRTRHLLIRTIQFSMDLGVLAAAFAGSYLLRFDFLVPGPELDNAARQLPMVVLLQFGALILAGAHRSIWRYVGLWEAGTILLGTISAALPILILRLALPVRFAVWRVPLSIIVIDSMLAFCGVLSLRLARRVLFEYREKRSRSSRAVGAARERALLVGAGRAGVLAAREIQSQDDLDLDVRGFVDDDPTKAGAEIQGFRVLGTTNDLPRLVQELKIDQVVITIARITRPNVLRIIDICRRIRVKLRVIPGLFEILQGKVQTTRLRIVQVEDLLAREPVQLDEKLIGHFLAGKTVMVTGAGGSIGSELARQVARVQPARLLLVERAEAALFEIDQDVHRIFPGVSVVPLVADVGDENRVRAIFAEHRPQVVFHAAAHKHVPMMESHPEEAIRNNVLATRLLGEMAAQFGVEAFVLISTDKAVRPTSVMGASKRLAEIVVQDLAFRHAGRFLAVRFGNVIGSAGSVIPIFRDQIRRGGPVTVTHPEMRRYFMTVREAATLVLQAGAMGDGGEIFVLDMGDPVKILDLAVAMINLSGLKPFEDMDIVFTGLRPGEKLFEELQLSGEEIAKTRHPKIFTGKLMGYSPERVQWAVSRLTKHVREGDPEAIRRFLNVFLPEAQLAVRGEAIEQPPRLEPPASWLATPEA